MFKGKVTIDGLEFTKESETIDTYVLDTKNGINTGNIAYRKPTKPWDIVALSMIWFDDTFEHINIASNWGQNKKLKFFIVSGSTYEEALDTQKKMRNKYGSDFVPRRD